MNKCKNCEHLVLFDYKNKSYSCEKWQCEFEPKEQEPTKNDLAVDCISRKAVLDELGKWDWQELYLPIHFKENIVDVLPSVTPQEPKTGHWINRGKQGEVLPFYMRYECSMCGETADKSNYCPNCGAKMAEVEE